MEKELEKMKVDCLFNKEKIDYNFHVLKKKEEENAKTISFQKRKTNKLQDFAAVLKNRLKESQSKKKIVNAQMKQNIENLIAQIKVQKDRSK